MRIDRKTWRAVALAFGVVAALRARQPPRPTPPSLARPWPRADRRPWRRPRWRRRALRLSLRRRTTNAPTRRSIHSLPASINGTTVGATLEQGESQSSCGVPTAGSVWYSLRASSAQRIALDLAAGGELDATIDVYHAVRSQLDSVGCQQTEGHGKASLSFKASKNGLYLIRVAALASSQLAGFSLEVFLPTPAVRPPGAPLPSGGVNGRVDRIQNINAAYSFTMHAGVSYLISLANETEARVRQRRAVRARHPLLRRRRRRRIGLRLYAAADQLRRLQAVHPRSRPGRAATASTSPRATPSAASSASTCRSLPPAPPKRRPGWRSATTPVRMATSADAARGCCACIAWK